MQPSPSSARVPLVLLVVSCLVTGLVVVSVVAARSTIDPAPVAPAPTGTGPRVVTARPEVRAATLLHDWDERRARAWADGDVRELRTLYVPGSRAGRHDAAMLRAWLRRGLRVRGLATQLLRVRLVRRTPARLVLAVTDRVSGVAAAAGGPARGVARGPAVDKSARARADRRGLAGRRRPRRRRPGTDGHPRVTICAGSAASCDVQAGWSRTCDDTI